MTAPHSRPVLAALLFGAIATFAGSTAAQAGNPGDGPLIAVLIDDIGHDPALGRRAIALPGPVAFAVLPHTPHAVTLAALAHGAGRDVILHQPFESEGAARRLGPGAITLDTGRAQFAQTLATNLAAVPHLSGLSNHMGSLLTRHPGHMQWLMEELSCRENLYFIDSYTTIHSVAVPIARAYGIPSVRRDVFLDDDPRPAAVAAEYARLRRLAARRGYALGIGHPYPATLALLERELPKLAGEGFRFVGLSDYVAVAALKPALIHAAWPRPAGPGDGDSRAGFGAP